MGKWVRYTFDLPFIAREEVMDCSLQDLFPIMPQDDKVDKYRDYVRNNYLAASNHFSVDMRADRTAETERTTNLCKLFPHAHFNASFLPFSTLCTHIY